MIRRGIIILLTLAALATAGLWVRSTGAIDYIAIGFTDKPRISIELISGRGVFTAAFVCDPTGLVGANRGLTVRSHGLTMWSHFAPSGNNRGFGGIAVHPARAPVHITITLRHWLLILLLAAHPAIAFIRGPVGRYRRRKRGLCARCGYDLTGNVSEVCSECGAKVKYD